MEVTPTIFVAVPRVYEKIYSQVVQKVKGFPKSAVYRWAVSVGRAHSPKILAGKIPTAPSWKLANKLVYSQVRARMGGRVKIFVSGGAPLGKELAQWYASIGIRIHEGYGLTETSPVIAINSPRAHKLGTVGRPLPNVEVRIADDSEILVRGPSVFRGYWNRPEDTSNAFVDGWFKTGDIGNLDDEGFLSVTDRKRDLLKTSGGKFIAPQPIENSIKLNALIGTAVVLGDRRKFAFVIISPHFPLLEEWARANHVSFFFPARTGCQSESEGSVRRHRCRGEPRSRSLRNVEKSSVGGGGIHRKRWHAHPDLETAPQGRRGALSQTDR